MRVKAMLRTEGASEPRAKLCFAVVSEPAAPSGRNCVASRPQAGLASSRLRLVVAPRVLVDALSR